MDLNRLGNKRAKRSRTWAYVCAGLFGGRKARQASTDDSEETR